MHAYHLVLLVACITCCICATTIFTRDDHPANKLAGTLIFGGAIWSFFEVLWNASDDPVAVMGLVKASTLGWAWIGPLGLHLILEVTQRPAPILRRILPGLYAFSATIVLLAWTTDWIHTSVVRTSWGWSYRFGGIWPVFYVVTVACLTTALSIGFGAWRNSPAPAERVQLGWMGVGILVPLVVASLTDGILPYLGVAVPHLGTSAYAVLGATVTASLYRFGFSLLAPGTFTREIVEAMRDGIALVSLDGRIRNGNAALAELLELPRESLADCDLHDHLDAPVLDADREADGVECQLHPASGRPYPVAISTALLRDRLGLPAGLVVVVRDLREVVGLRQRLLISGRMAAVGQLAAGVAHEINNPTTYVRANLVQLQSAWKRSFEHPRPEDWRELAREGAELISESLEGVDRTAAIVREIREFSHAGDGARESVELDALLDSVERVAAPQIRGRARIVRHRGALPPITCAAREIQQVLLNLVLNAVDAVEAEGLVEIRTVAEPDGRTVRVDVQDDGAGIHPEDVERIFDPFFTTKRVGEGTGLGLALSYEIVRRHGGEIEVHSEPGIGTRLTVRLPATPLDDDGASDAPTAA